MVIKNIFLIDFLSFLKRSKCTANFSPLCCDGLADINLNLMLNVNKLQSNFIKYILKINMVYLFLQNENVITTESPVSREQ